MQMITRTTEPTIGATLFLCKPSYHIRKVIITSYYSDGCFWDYFVEDNYSGKAHPQHCNGEPSEIR